MARVDYALVDADNHYYEPRDCFTRFAEPGIRGRAVQVVEHNGTEAVVVDGRPFTFLANPFFETTSKPGSLREMLRALSSGDFDENELYEPVRPEYTDRDARLATMDEQGVESCVMFPTVGVCVEHFLKHDIDLTYGSLRAFNRWLDETWGFNHGNRIHAPALLSLLDIDRAVIELDWALDRGARVVHLRPGPQGGRSLADPVFDPFWARINEANVVVAFHISESGYNELFSAAWGEEPNPSSHKQSAFQWTNFYGDRPIMDTMSALVLHNLFGRFPNVRVMSIENGSLWVPYLLKAMDKMKGMGRNGPWLGGRVDGRPSEILKRHLYVSPYHEEDIEALVELIGVDHVIFGSDWPHPEGLAEPVEFAERLGSLGYDETRRIMRENTHELLTV